MASAPLCSKSQIMLEDSSSSTPELSSDDSSDCQVLPTMENITPYKRVGLPATCFVNGCICGHQFEYRDVFYDSRKRRHIRSPGITIKVQSTPVPVSLRSIH